MRLQAGIGVHVQSAVGGLVLLSAGWARIAHALPEDAPEQAAPAPAEPPVATVPAPSPEKQPASAAFHDEKAAETELPRESAIENALGRAPVISGSAFGGYGELTLNAPSNAPSEIGRAHV